MSSHWPNCNWCTASGGTYSVHSEGEVNNTFPDNDSNNLNSPGSPGYEEVGQGVEDRDEEEFPAKNLAHHSPSGPGGFSERNSFPASPLIHYLATGSEEAISFLPQVPLDVPLPLPTLPPSDVIPSLSTHDSPSQITDSSVGNTHGPAQAVAKTSKTTCTPSPTESLPPSASTWS